MCFGHFPQTHSHHRLFLEANASVGGVARREVAQVRIGAATRVHAHGVDCRLAESLDHEVLGRPDFGMQGDMVVEVAQRNPRTVFAGQALGHVGQRLPARVVEMPPWVRLFRISINGSLVKFESNFRAPTNWVASDRGSEPSHDDAAAWYRTKAQQIRQIAQQVGRHHLVEAFTE